MRDSSSASGEAAREFAPVTERLLEKLDVVTQRLNDLAHKHGEPALLDLQHRLWLIIRYFRNDDELSRDDIDL